MPTRYIKESARTSKNLCAVSDFSERLFWRLITTADDFGRFLACPVIVKSTCFPLVETMKAVRVERALHEMAQCELIKLYRVGDRDYGWFVNWEKHQGEPRAKSSKYPDPTVQASADTCGQLPAYVPGAPNTKANTNPSSPDLKIPDLKSIKHTKTNGLAEFPGEWKLSEDEKGQASGLGLNPLQEFARFRDYHKAKGTKFKDWTAAWRNWTRKAVEMKEARA